MEEVTIKLDKYDSMMKELNDLRNENNFLKENTGKVLIEVTNNTFSNFKPETEWDNYMKLQNMTYSDEEVKRIKLIDLEDLEKFFEKKAEKNVETELTDLKDTIKSYQDNNEIVLNAYKESYNIAIEEEIKKRTEFELKYYEKKASCLENEIYYKDKINELKNKIPWWK